MPCIWWAELLIGNQNTSGSYETGAPLMVRTQRQSMANWNSSHMSFAIAFKP